MRASGISQRFHWLSRSPRQVSHVLLTRSPLSTQASPGFTFDLHVLSAPPAFVLSQDQTLHQKVLLTTVRSIAYFGEPPHRDTDLEWLAKTSESWRIPMNVHCFFVTRHLHSRLDSCVMPALAFCISLLCCQGTHPRRTRFDVANRDNRSDTRFGSGPW